MSLGLVSTLLLDRDPTTPYYPPSAYCSGLLPAWSQKAWNYNLNLEQLHVEGELGSTIQDELRSSSQGYEIQKEMGI